MIWPRVMSNSVIDELVGVASAFGAKLPYGPILSMLRIEEGNETIKRIAIGTLGIGLRGTGRCDDVVGNVAKIQPCLGMSGARPRDDLA